MRLAVISRVTGVLLALFSLVMLGPAAIAFFHDEAAIKAFAPAFVITLLSGLALLATGPARQGMRSGDGFLVTVLFYAGLGRFGAIPFYLEDGLNVSFTDAAFESLSGLTTTGATVLAAHAEVNPVLLTPSAMARWNGHHRAYGRNTANARHWRPLD